MNFTGKRSTENSKQPRRDGRTVTVGRVEDLPVGLSATIELDDGTELALYHVGEEFYALENFCPHRGAPLADGPVCEHAVECNWHGWRFDVRTGACLNRAGENVETYTVTIEEGLIKITI